MFILFVRVCSGTIRSFKISVEDLMLPIFLAIYRFARPHVLYGVISGVKDTGHVLLHYHSYDAYRRDLLDTVNSTLQPYGLPNLSYAPFLKMILYSDERLSIDSNSEILKATLRYIYATQRSEKNDATKT